jgi:hypothetical protein
VGNGTATARDAHTGGHRLDPVAQPADQTRPEVGSLTPGARVEVRSDYAGWSSGFAVEEVTEDGYRLRRASDGSVLPRVFPFDAVRRERRKMWWV